METTAEPCQATGEHTRLHRMLRKHLHDLRNCIHGLDLEVALLAELVAGAEATEGVRRIAGQIAQLEAITRGLSIRLSTPQRVSITAGDLLQLWKYQVAGLEDPSRPFLWSVPPEAKRLELDPTAITTVLRELTEEALKQSPGQSIQTRVRTTEEEVIAELRILGPHPGMPEQWVADVGEIVALSSGAFECAEASATDEWVMALRFPAAADEASASE